MKTECRGVSIGAGHGRQDGLRCCTSVADRGAAWPGSWNSTEVSPGKTFGGVWEVWEKDAERTEGEARERCRRPDDGQDRDWRSWGALGAFRGIVGADNTDEGL